MPFLANLKSFSNFIILQDLLQSGIQIPSIGMILFVKIQIEIHLFSYPYHNLIIYMRRLHSYF